MILKVEVTATGDLLQVVVQVEEDLAGLPRAGNGEAQRAPHMTPFIALPAGRTLKACWLQARDHGDYFSSFRPLQVRMFQKLCEKELCQPSLC